MSIWCLVNHSCYRFVFLFTNETGYNYGLGKALPDFLEHKT